MEIPYRGMKGQGDKDSSSAFPWDTADYLKWTRSLHRTRRLKQLYSFHLSLQVRRKSKEFEMEDKLSIL